MAEVGDELIALDPRTGSSFGLNAVAASVWRSLDQPRSLVQLRDRLMADHDVPGDQCTADVDELLAELVDKGLVEKRAKAMRPDMEIKPRHRTFHASGERGQWTDSAEDRRAAFAPELALVVECCRWTFAGGPLDVRTVSSSVDWPLFLRLVRFHRVQGLVWNCLAKRELAVPPEVAGALAGEAASIAVSALRAATESRELLDLFAKAELPALLVKGVTLGARAYGNAALKTSIDIDLLVPGGRLSAATDLLRQRGYRLESPRGSPARLRTWHKLRKESTWLRLGSQVDLHTRLADNPRMIPSIGLNSPRQTVEVFNGIDIPTLADEELFAYLAVHGASSAWFRLKWITDFAALAHRLGPNSIEPLYRRSQVLGAGRAADQALLLADHLFGTLRRNPDLAEELRRGRASTWLYRLALKQLAGRAEPVEPTARFLGTAAIHYSQFPMLPGAAFPISEFVRQSRSLFA